MNDPGQSEARATREAIILVAERMIAEQGFDALSLREVARAAGLGNNSAVRYHFGSKEGLIQGIFEHRALQMEPYRGAMLAEAEASGSIRDPRRLWEIVFLPYLALRSDDGYCAYAAFMIHYMTYKRPIGMRHIADFGSTVPHLRRTLDLIAAALAHLAPEVADRRQFMATVMFYSNLVNQWQRPNSPDKEPFDDFLNDLLDQITAACFAPLSTPVEAGFAARIVAMDQRSKLISAHRQDSKT